MAGVILAMGIAIWALWEFNAANAATAKELEGTVATLSITITEQETAIRQAQQEHQVTADALSRTIAERDALAQRKQQIITKIREIEVPADAPPSLACLDYALPDSVDAVLTGMYTSAGNSDKKSARIPTSARTIFNSNTVTSVVW